MQGVTYLRIKFIIFREGNRFDIANSIYSNKSYIEITISSSDSR